MVELIDWELAMEPVIAELEPDLIHAHDFGTIGLAERSANRQRAQGRNVKVVYDAHEYTRGIPNQPPDRLQAYVDLEREHIPRVDAILAVSPLLAESLQRDHGLTNQPTVVMNTPLAVHFDPSSDLSVRRQAGVIDAPLIVYSGGIDPHRGLGTLIEAMHLMPDVHLALVVRSIQHPSTRSVLELARELGCDSRVHPVPFVDTSEVTTYLRTADIGVHTLTHCPNHEVALPNKLFEYLHAELPVVVSDVQSMAEFVDSENVGEVFEAGNPQSLAKACQKVLADLPTFTQQVKRADIRRRFSWEAQEKHLLQVYGHLLNDELETQPADPKPILEDQELLVPRRRASSSTRRRVLIGPRNMAGQATQWARAIDQHLPAAAAEVFARPPRGPLRYPVHLWVSEQDWQSLEWQLWWMRHLITTYSHTLLEWGEPAFGMLNNGFFDGDAPALERHNVKLGLVFHGSDIRDPAKHRDLEVDSPYSPDDPMTQRLQARVDELSPRVSAFNGTKLVSTQGLLDFVSDATWLPLTIDITHWHTDRFFNGGRRPVVVHAPSSDWLKGSAGIDGVCEELDRKGLIEYRRVKGVRPESMPAILRDADIVLDQFALGDYGVLACEALASSCLVIGHIRDSVRNRFDCAVPIIEARASQVGDVLADLVLSSHNYEDLITQGQTFVRRFHDGRSAALVLAEFLDLSATDLDLELDRSTIPDGSSTGNKTERTVAESS